MNKPAVRRYHPWRWMVAFSRFFWTFICLGSFKSMGVFLPYFVDSFSSSTAVAGSVTSLILGFGLLSCGPLVGALMKVWDSRKLTVVGGALAAICTIAASTSSTMAQLAVWFALTSIGLALIQVSTVKPLMDYFPDNFAMANGVTLTGGTIGMMVLPPVVEALVSMYGWRTALGLIGAFSFNYVVCGLLLRPLPYTPTPYTSFSNQAQARYGTSNPTEHPDAGQGSNTETQRRNVLSVFATIMEVLRERFDTRLLIEPMFIIYQVVTVLNGMIYSSWHVFLIPQGIELGYGELSAFLATFGGAGSFIGRVSHGTIIDRGLFRASTLFVIASLIFAVSSLLDTAALPSYAALAFLATVSGVAIGVTYPLNFVLMREVTEDHNTAAYSWLFLSHGGGQILGGLFSGWIHDITGDFQYVFVTMGITSLIMSAILILTRCLTSFRGTSD